MSCNYTINVDQGHRWNLYLGITIFKYVQLGYTSCFFFYKENRARIGLRTQLHMFLVKMINVSFDKLALEYHFLMKYRDQVPGITCAHNLIIVGITVDVHKRYIFYTTVTFI